MARPTPAIIMALLLTFGLAAGCGGSSTVVNLDQGGQVRGTVVEVVARNILELELLRIRDDAGKLWSFSTGEGFIGFTPSHLREHQLAGEPVIVRYTVQGETLLAVEVAD